jgi:hypothetical protein
MQSRLNVNVRIFWSAVFAVVMTVVPWHTDVFRQAAAAGKSVASSSASEGDFPYTVSFKQGETKFVESDKISITEVRGTDPTLAVGNIYVIRGTYKLASHDRAMLCASVTAIDAENGRCTGLKVQNAVVPRGSGTFTLYLPMSYRGWPHVSFYPADGGEGFGGTYFGIGDSLHKH